MQFRWWVSAYYRSYSSWQVVSGSLLQSCVIPQVNTFLIYFLTVIIFRFNTPVMFFSPIYTETTRPEALRAVQAVISSQSHHECPVLLLINNPSQITLHFLKVQYLWRARCPNKKEYDSKIQKYYCDLKNVTFTWITVCMHSCNIF